MNQTLKAFGYPTTLIKEYDHWVLVIRPKQVTLGACTIIAKADVTSLAALPPAAGAELIGVMADFERMLRDAFGAVKFNYLALMMVDPNPHFHAIPRYDRAVEFRGHEYADELWPKPPDLTRLLDMNDITRADIQNFLKQNLEGQK